MAMDVPSLEETASESQSNQMRFVLEVVSRHWTVIFAVVAVSGFVGTAIGYTLQENQYEYNAATTLVVKPSLYDAPWMMELGGTLFGKPTASTIIELTSTQSLAEDIARAMVQQELGEGRPLGAVTTAEEYESQAGAIAPLISLVENEDATALVVNVAGDSPERAEMIAELAARILLDRSQQYFLDEQELTQEAVRSELESLGDQLNEAESVQWVYHEEMGYRTHDQLVKEIQRRSDEEREAELEENELQTRIAKVVEAMLENREFLSDDLERISEEAIAKLKDGLDELLSEKAELQLIYNSESPFMTPLSNLEDDIKFKRDAVLLAIHQLGGEDGLAIGAWEQQKNYYAEKASLEFKLSDIRIRRATLDSVRVELKQNLSDLGEGGLVYERLAHEAKQIRLHFNQMLDKEFEIKMAKSRGLAKLERRDAVIVGATLAGAGSPIWVTGLMGAAIGFIVAFAFAMMLEVMDTSIRTPEDMSQHFNFEVLGLIPMMTFGKKGARRRRRGPHVVTGVEEEAVDQCIVTQIDPKSPVSEAYRSFRTNFQFATLQSKPKTVMFTSAVPGEGKTTTAVNFAVTMADRGMRVLIVDTDLRRPNVHRVLKMERGPGLADVLRENVSIKDVIRPTRVDNLWIISSGRVPPNPSELIGSERMQSLLGGLSDSFDLVVCDAPSILVVTDPVLLASHVDSVAMVVAVNNARRETIARAAKLLETAQPTVVGVVLNGLEATRKHYYYYYYYDDAASPGRRRWYHNL